MWSENRQGSVLLHLAQLLSRVVLIRTSYEYMDLRRNAWLESHTGSPSEHTLAHSTIVPTRCLRGEGDGVRYPTASANGDKTAV